MVSPVVTDKIDFGDTVRDDGAKMLSSHIPGNDVSRGPVHVVFLQHV